MEVFAFHILKLNIIAAILIVLTKIVSTLLKDRVSVRWKYFVWLFIAASLFIPVQIIPGYSIVNVQIEKENGGEKRLEAQQQIEKRTSALVESGTELSGGKYYILHESREKMEIFARIFLIVWLGIALLKVTSDFLGYFLSMRRLERMSVPVENSLSIQIYRDVCQKKNIHKRPQLRQNAGLTTPLLAGFLHPKLFLPATGYSASEKKLVFHHELTHYCHKDLWYKMFLHICVSVYWFNPFLLLMQKEADRDIENLCDTAVIHGVSKQEYGLYRKLLLRTVAMNSYLPFVSASLNDSTMVFKDRIFYMLNLKKHRKGILPGLLLSMLLVSGNIIFTVSAGDGSNENANTLWNKTTDMEESFYDSELPSEMVDMQPEENTSGSNTAGSGTHVEIEKNDFNGSTSSANSEINLDVVGENNSQENNTFGNSSSVMNRNNENTDSTSSGVPYTSGFNTPSGVASIVAAGGDENSARVLTDNGDGTYSDETGSRYRYQGNGSWSDEDENTYQTWNDRDYSSGTYLEHRELQGSAGAVDIQQTTNGDYYYRDANGIGYTDNGDGTWTDENGNKYTE